MNSDVPESGLLGCVRRKKTVLAVDDQPELRRLVYHTLKHRYLVLEAGDADAAIGMVERELVDLVLLDLHLPPRLDSPEEGLRAHRKIGELSREIPVVIVSSHDTPGLRESLLQRGARDFLAKPVDAGTLTRLVAELLPE